ncbi:hypothetical protein L249_8058 [Ophiocordyceps polyrhachis-furcata BCC 54312]|uniref:Sodium/calcium exchanger membrane region domain-containing protein n=1 Tax=Ophiocordyceps polyrhachis-furcata BCC 54312 TaxID=1330021 RepID=A0A367LIP7_9HYPO|nr:hypothetical protein L249_8058 [Ophiocordyceps polyrhachis-furcata BCC 54312]
MASNVPFNHFRNKRQAHAVSRASSEAWNPFRHVWGRERRVQTWAALEEEQQHHGMTYSATAPTARRQRSEDDEASQAKTPSSVDAEATAAGLRNRKPDDAATDEKKSEAGDDKKGRFLRRVEPKTPFTLSNQLQRTFLNSWINVLLFAAPVGIAINYVPSIPRVAVFVVNFIAIIPLAALLSFATEEIALRTGETLGGLLNATFGNAVEVIVSIIALIDGKIQIVKTSLIGSILSNLLLVMGCCFFFGGLRRQEQHFNTVVAQTAASLLALAAASVIVPTVFDAAQNTPVSKVAALSRGTAVILLVVYAAYLFFQLKTHQTVFSEESQKVPAKPWGIRSSSSPPPGAIHQALAIPGSLMGQGVQEPSANERLSRMLLNPLRYSKKGDLLDGTVDDDEDEEEEEAQLHFGVALATLTISTAIIALCAEFMVDSIDAVTRNGALSEEFLGLILLPIVGNAAEHATAVTVAMKDKMDLAIGVAVGSSMQIALFVIPFIVLVGWGMHVDPMNLSFDFFQTATMFMAVLLVNYLIGDGKSHWLEGFLLICLYAIVGVCAFYYPNSAAEREGR